MSIRKLIEYPQWAPLSGLCQEAVEVVERVHSLGSGWYALTNAGFGGSEDDPGVGGILWASSEGVALLVSGNRGSKIVGHGAADSSPPNLDIPWSFGEIVRSEKSAGRRPQHNATYDFSSGEFLCSELELVSKKVYFESPNPADEDAPIAVLLRLTTR